MKKPGTVGDKKPPTPKAIKEINRVLRQVRNLVEHLRAVSNTTESRDLSAGVIMFFDKTLGGYSLKGDEARHYRACLESLVKLHGDNPDLRVLSRRAAEGLLKKTILRALRPRSKRDGDRAKFKRRLDREVRRLRAELTAQPEEWLVTVQAHGFASKGLPFQFGGVEFEAGNAETAAKVASQLRDFEPKRSANRKRIEADQRMREDDRKRILDCFAAAIIAKVVVRAMDAEASRHLGIERIRRTIDILNFFAPYFHSGPYVPRAFLGIDGRRVSVPWVVCSQKEIHWSCHPAKSVREENDPIAMIDACDPQAVKIGMARAGLMIETETPSDLEARIINSLIWAGRASTEPRRDVAFLLFAISLEALLTKPSARGGVTDRVRFRVAHLIGQSPEARKHVLEMIVRLYKVRSELVHAGDATALTDSDLSDIRMLTQYAIIRVLTDARFSKMESAADFEQWLDEQLIVGALPTAGQGHAADGA